MLHRTSKEIDKDGNVIGGELKEKCDSFVACLEEFEREYLSNKFNAAASVSGREQQNTLSDFKSWLEKTTRKYSLEKKSFDDYVAELKQSKGQIEFCYNESLKRKLNPAKIEKIMKILFADYTRKCNEINAKNAQIMETNRKIQTNYEASLALYHAQESLYRVTKRAKGIAIPPIMPIPPRYLKLLPLPKGPSVPTRMTDELFRKICKIVSEQNMFSPPHISSDYKENCKKYVAPLLGMALNYCNELIKGNDLNMPQQILNWFTRESKNSGNINIYKYLIWLCPYGAMGFPIYDPERKLADIYWTCLFLDFSKAFRDIMKKFKENEKGTSSTKKWIDKVVKSLSKGIRGGSCKELLKNILDNLAKSFKIKAPTTISKRPTIKQKPVKSKLEELIKHIEECKKNVPDLKFYS